ncbi:SPOR domain-containing protein [Undibacterium sp. CY7W]|uniref:SPOR domain-containing protein n=1 Tax=Undibacterium rugosum TaxID=2762291 RepID=A0A923I2L5_9BURK|nr:SPOR domain-containing protein [Undibacterium rugosum]MBC3935352.1 SPOR domain-containing protein [Undibacterium rugosum]
MGLFSRFKKQDTSDSYENGEFRSRAEEDSVETRSRTKKAAASRRSRVEDPILPEKKRARRRLIGASAIALAAVIGLPMLFDSEPKPLGDDVQIRIPSKDKAPELASNQNQAESAEAGSNRRPVITPAEPVEEIIEPAPPLPKAKDLPSLPKTESKPATGQIAALAATPEKNVKTERQPDVMTEARRDIKEIKTESKAEAKPEPKSTDKTQKASEKEHVKPEVKVEAKPERKPEPKAEPAKPVKNAASDDEAARALAILEGKTPAKPQATTKAEHTEKSSYTVQVAALASQEKVDELQSKLRSANIRSYTQKVATSSGDKIRVRIGPFESKEEADKARAKLDKLGLSGTLVPN